MNKDSFQANKMSKFLVFLALLISGTILAGDSYASVAEKPQPSEEEYQTQYDNAVNLGELLRKSPDMLHNKLYTAEQEVELQALVDSVCSSAKTDRAKVGNLLACIFNNLEPGACYGLNGWDTLCDGENEMIDTAGKTVAKKKAVNEEVYCFTFYDVCRLAGIPCFILEDDFTNASKNQYIAMVYIESASGSGKEWYFVDVAEEKMLLSSRKFVYEDLGTSFYPQNLVLDYDKALYFRNTISLKKKVEVDGKEAPLLVYDSTTDTVKSYFTRGVLAAGEQYHMTEKYIGEDGEAPSGWIETKNYSSGTVTTYRSYAVCGVFLRGRVEIEGKEYELQNDDFLSYLPYYDHASAESEPESQEHKDFVLGYKKQLEEKAIAYTEALLADKNYIWDDTYFGTEEDEKLLRDAVDTALDWNYIQKNEASGIAFQTAGIPFKSLAEQEPGEMSDKAKAQAILLYIKKNVKSVDHGANFVNSPTVLKQGEGTCAGISLLYRDMCVMAGVPCFQLHSSLGMKQGDVLYGDHASNMIRVGDEWLFCDPMNMGVIGKGDCYPLGIFEGYDTANNTEIKIDRDAVRKDNYYKWSVAGGTTWRYFEFDSERKLGIYQRNWFGEPVVDSETDENGRYIMENGLQTVDVPEMNEDRSVEIVTQYAYYHQNLRTLQGKKVIDGQEYTFDTDVKGYANCHKLQEVSRRYVISKLTFQPLEDQPFEEDGVCPVPEIYHGEKKLEYGKDFIIVEYKHNKEITTYADASYKVEGIGDYMGEATRYFKVVQVDLSELEVTLSQTSIPWRPDAEYRKPKVDLGVSAQNYSVAYYDFDKIGKARVVITGKGNCKGSVTKEYDITPGVWNEEEFMITDKNGELLQSQKFYYRFSPIAAEARVCWQDEKGRMHILSEAFDYDISYSDTEHPGTVTVTATAKGKYQGTLTCTYKIMPYFVWEDSIRAKYTQTVYNGTVQKPAVTIGNLVEGKDFFVSYEKKVNGGYQEADPKEVGEYRIVVRMSEDMAFMKEGISEEDASNICYISYFIQADGNSGSGTGNGGSDTGTAGNNTGGSSAGGNGQITDGDIDTGRDSEKTDTEAGKDKKAAIPKIAKVSGLKGKVKTKGKKKTLDLTWKKVSGAGGYQVQISTKKSFKGARKISVKKGKRRYKTSKLLNKKKYYVRVRAWRNYKTENGKVKKAYGKWKMIRI